MHGCVQQPLFFITERAGSPCYVPECEQRPQFDKRMEVAEEDVAGQVDEIAGVASEMGEGFDEFGAEDPEAEG